MKINLILALGLWSTAGIVLVALLRWWHRQRVTPLGWPLRSIFFVLGLLALIVLLRPHEDWIGGQDGGAYMNLAARFAKTEAPLYKDAMIGELQPGAFDAFRYYAHNSAYLTKYGTEWVRDPESGKTGPWFQPAFPLLLSLVVRLGGAWSSAFVIPAFAWLNGWLLGLLILSLTRCRRAAMAATVLYWFNPLVIWHGRAPRPEFIASFFVLGGIILLGEGINRNTKIRERLWYGATAGVCLGLAPFFHITAWNAAVPAALVVAVLLLRGERGMAFYPPVVAGGFLLFCAQLAFWSDTYGLKPRFLAPLLASPTVLAVLAVGVGLLLLAYAWCLRSARQAADVDGRRSRRACLASMAAMALLLGGVTLWAILTRPTVDMHYVQSYVNRTDLVTAARMVSSWLAGVAAVGLVVLAGAPDRRSMRVAVLVLTVLLPPALLIGNMYDFFMTRYLITAWVPLLVIGLVLVGQALVTRVGNRFADSVSVAYVIVLLAVSLLPRRHWISTREYRDYYETAESVAQPVLQSGGMLLVEYSRLGAIFDHVFGIPTLGINDERIDDRLQDTAEEAWGRLMRRFPARPAYLLSAYPHPASERFAFEPVVSRILDSEVLQTHRWGLPSGVRPWKMGFYLYRMREHAGLGEPPEEDLYLRPMHAGRFGLRGFDRPDYRQWGVLKLEESDPGGYRVAVSPESTPESSVLHFFYYSEREPATPVLRVGESARALETRALLPGWHWGRCRLPGNTAEAQLVTETPILLNAIWQESEGGILRLRPDGQDLAHTLLERVAVFAGRAGQRNAELTLPPATSGSPVALLLLLPEEVGPAVDCQIWGRAEESISKLLPTGRWMWTLWSGLTDPETAARLRFSLPQEAALAAGDTLPFHVMLGAAAVWNGNVDRDPEKAE